MRIRTFGALLGVVTLVASAGVADVAVGTSISSASQSSTVTVGLIGQFSGASAQDYGGVPEALKAWASSLNARKGLNGHKVKVVSMDTGQGVEPGLADAKELIGQDHAVALVDFDQTPDDATWLPYAQSHKVPVIVAYGGSTYALKDPDAFPVVPGAAEQIYSTAAEAVKIGPNFGNIYCAESPQCAEAGSFTKELGAGLGLNVPVLVSASSTAPDYTAVCQDLAGAVQSYSLSFGSASALQDITDTCFAQGIKIPQILNAAGSAPYWKSDSAFAGDPVLDSTVPYFARSTPAEKAYRVALNKYAANLDGTDIDNAPDLWVWAAGQLVATAARTTTKTPTASTIIKGLYSLKKVTLGGLVQPLTFVKNKPTWLNCNFVWKIGSNGAFQVVNNAPSCIPQADINAVSEEIVKSLP